MGTITNCNAYCNNEVAFVAWAVDDPIDGCLGFEVTRVYLKDDGSVDERVVCAAWVAFKGQRNPHWQPQDTSVWPVQKFSWRDLTLRKKRQGMTRRPDEVRVRFEVRPVGNFKPGLEPVAADAVKQVEVNMLKPNGDPVLGADNKPIKVTAPEYEGTPRKLGYLAPAVASNDILVTRKRGMFQSTFTNGILAAQWLRNVLYEDGIRGKDELVVKLKNPKDPHRRYLAGDTLPMIHEFFARDGEFFLSLYELEDEELEKILLDNAARIHVILSNTGADSQGVWDERNSPARTALINAGVDIQHRMFNNEIHIGHNKFVVNVPAGGGPRAVLTGSTNWTWTGISAQTNNAILIEDDAVAGTFLDYWDRMKLDALAVPDPFGNKMGANQQSKAFRKANETVVTAPSDGNSSISVWFSPNRQERQKPTSKTKPTPIPPDLEDLYRRIRKAEQAIFFLAFYPAQSAKDCLISEAISLGLKDREVLIFGAVSSPMAMPNYVPATKDAAGNEIKAKQPSTFIDQNISIVRASAVDDAGLLGDLGEEQLTPRGSIGAIIHDKIMVIDPLSDKCSVVFGSHNLGLKASYSNDENMIIVDGNRALAEAYMVHILDVYDHYRFRAVQAERKAQGKSLWSGFLETDDQWQARYLTGARGVFGRYMSR